MEWSATCAARAYFDTLQLGSWRVQEPGSNEFVSALAAGMKAKLIVEVTSRASSSTIALAAAAKQTGGRLVCILPEPVLDESKQVVRDSGLNDQVEFRTEDPSELLPSYEQIDFSLVDCKNESYTRLLSLLYINLTRSVVVAKNLGDDRKRLGGYVRRKDEKVAVRSLKHPIGKGMEVTMISMNDETDNRVGVCFGVKYNVYGFRLGSTCTKSIITVVFVADSCKKKGKRKDDSLYYWDYLPSPFG